MSHKLLDGFLMLSVSCIIEDDKIMLRADETQLMGKNVLSNFNVHNTLVLSIYSV